MLWKVIANKYNHRMKFGNFYDEGGSYFGSLGLEDGSKSDNKVLFFASGSTDPVLYEGEHALPRVIGYKLTMSLPGLCRNPQAEGAVRVHRCGY